MKIPIKGVIVSNDNKWIYDLFDIESVSPREILTQMEKANGADLEFEINSPGGEVYAGLEMYTAIKEYKGNTLSKVVAIAASAATLAAIAAKKVVMTPPGQLMIHNAAVSASGDHRNLEHGALVLKSHDEGIAMAYMLKTGLSKEELLQLMADETYLNAEKALKNKFIDEIMFDENQTLVAAIPSMIIPDQIINKIKNLKALGVDLTESGAIKRPVSDITPDLKVQTKDEPEKPDLSVQTAEFRKLKLKILGGQ